MSYIPNTDADRRDMLAVVGAASIDELFRDIPEGARLERLDLPPALSEPEAVRLLRSLAARNRDVSRHASFLGAGAYWHYIPSVVGQITGRNEFYTAYTPYQPEVSQGTLQTIYEYQSMVAELTGMDAANASMYDGASALAEAMIMARAATGRGRVVIAESVHPHYRAVARTYAEGPELEVVEPPAERGRAFDGRLAPDVARRCIDGQTAALIVQQPNFLGSIEDLRALAAVAHDAGALFVVAANPIALALLEAPGAAGADIVVGEGQPLGIPLSFGGPWLGLFAAREQYVRQMPGRIVGVTTDVDGRRGFVLTLQAREQHIRRERATSNICTNQALCALASTVYMATLGKEGLRQVAEVCLRRAHHAAERIGRLEGYALANTAPFFHEFVVRCPRPVDELVRRLEDDGILAGYRLGRSYPDLTDALLFCVTEMNTPDDIERLVAALEKARG
ncbi:MAG TPA: aminomethyl-transferring glycine dehydrogenase subunit GcvPA [Chloroflexota bacterium]|jgi:glycine dehydrogenase subunit 1|nr:aminomethyl-transferring glycine dehydrogenase subunit GcvPA [Chloroflexota bacterium]